MKKSIQKKIRTSYRWAKLREIYREQHPYCEDPLRLHWKELATAQAVHHIEPIVTMPLLAFDTGNLAALCHSCHARIEKLTQANKNTQGLFRKKTAEIDKKTQAASKQQSEPVQATVNKELTEQTTGLHIRRHKKRVKN